MTSWLSALQRRLRAGAFGLRARLSAITWAKWDRPVLVIAISVAVLFNLVPLELPGSLDASLAELIAGLLQRSDDVVSLSLVQRLLVYLPLGLLTYGSLALHGRRRRFVATVLVITFVGLGVEIMQGFLSRRHAFLVDFLMVMVVGGLAALLGEIAAGLVTDLRRALDQILVLANVLAIGAMLLARGGSDLAGWDCSYPLVIGNEATSDRPWIGKLRGFAIYSRAIADKEIDGIAVGFAEPGAYRRREALGAALIYDFEKRSLEGAAGRPNAAAKIKDGELQIRRPATIRPRQPMADVCREIKAAGAFSIEVEFRSEDLAQDGPARILSFSLDPLQRNFTLGQDRRRLNLRIRNRLNGDNGLEQAIVTDHKVISGEWQHLVARYDRGVTELFLNGAMLQQPVDYDSLILVASHRAVPLPIVCGLLSLVLGAVALRRLKLGDGRARRWRPLAAGALAATPQLAVAAAISQLDQRFIGMSALLWIAISTAFGIAAASLWDQVTVRSKLPPATV